jgi:ABC-type multidrug transport system ATPase subunit
MGPNGAGKSTLLKLLTHKLIPVEGTVTDHPDFTLAYFGQHSTAELNLENTAIEFLISQFPKANTGALRNHLAKTGIIGTQADTRMKGLSFSQRSCIVFAKLTFVCPHLLIMDEPTNFLDLESVDSLISACNKYQGALLLVSHNRDFLKKCARQYLSIVPGRFELYDTLKVAERATYTFIEEMESGHHVTAKDAIMNNPGGGTIHSSQKVEQKVEAATTVVTEDKETPKANVEEVKEKKQEDTPSSSSSSSSEKVESLPAVAAPTTPVVIEEEPASFSVGEKISALWTDGKWYPGIIKSYNDKLGKFSVTYTGYGNTASLPLSSMKKLAAPVANGQQNGNKRNQSNDRQSSHKPRAAASGNARRDVNRR